uniref:Flavin-containing monooxygenase n=1 Tax=Arion vulgaris TaxID=1028688 RepID=A0A0B6Y0T3_9EUPU
MKKVITVTIIGAGAAGLCALRQLTHPSASELIHFNVVCFEQAPRVGGTWFYTDQVGKDEHDLPVHSSMYENLRTNLPKECMAYPDYSFPELPSFVGHADVQKYLEDYAAHFDVLKYIKFQTIVTSVKPVCDKTNPFGTSWEVTTKSGTNFSVEKTSTFNAIIVCNGHYSIPMFPDILGLDTFSGEVMHSHDYRRPSVFTGKRVVLLGAASSGQDISLEVSSTAEQVFLSHNKPPIKAPLPDNVQQKPGINRVNKCQVEFLDGSREDVDVLLLCTGYYYNYSFLSPECGIEVKDSRVTPLYKHLIHTKYPNFGIMGVCKVVVPFPMFDVQARFFRSILDGTLILPSEEDMNRDTEEDYRSRLEAGMPHRHAHFLDEKQYSYNDELADMAKTTRLPEHFKQLCRLTRKLRQTNLMGYKKVNFELDEKKDIYKIAT